MKILTKNDLPAIHMAVVKRWPIESSLLKKWDEVTNKMGVVTSYETIRDIKLFLMLATKVESILVNEVALRGREETLKALNILETLTGEAKDILNVLEGK